jgi:multisubunit Na+/H+ antiporter MnhF subunit
MNTLFLFVTYFALFIHVAMMAIAVWRVWRGENVIDRILGLELSSTLLLAILVLISLIFQSNVFIDVALALAALGFISTLALARFVVREQMY